MVPHDVARRTSPWTVGFELLGFASAITIGVVVLLVGGDPAELVQLGFGALVLLGRAAGWWFRTYTVTDDHLELDEGIFQRRHRTVPYARVQQIDLHQGLLHRPVGMATVRIETAGEGGATAIALKVLPVAEAGLLRDLVLARRRAATQPTGATAGATGPAFPPPMPPPPTVEVLRLDGGDVLLAAVTELALGVLAAALLPVGLAVILLGRALGGGEVADVVTVVGVGTAWTGGLAAGAVALLAVPLLLRDWGYVLRADGQDLHVRHGLLSVQEQTLPRARLQQVTVIDNPLRRALGIASVVLHSAAGAAAVEGQSNAVRIPLVRTGVLAGTIEAVAGPRWAVPELRRRSDVARRRAVRRRVGILVLLLGPTVVLAPLALLGIPWGRAAHRRAGYGATPAVAAFASGVLHHRLDLVPRRRIQSARCSSSPFQRRLGLATVWLDVAGGSTRGPLTSSPHLHDLEGTVADEAMRRLGLR
jgi:putative membrane protein